MFPVAWFVVALYLIAYALAGMAIGAITGWLISKVTSGDRQKLVADAFLGALGYLAGFIGCIFVPWPENTIVKPLAGGGTVETTMSRYQHPERVAIVVAILFPLLHQLYRWQRHKERH